MDIDWDIDGDIDGLHAKNALRCPRLLMAKFPIDGGTANAHVNIGSILPSQRLCLDPLVHLARFEKNLTLRCDGDV